MSPLDEGATLGRTGSGAAYTYGFIGPEEQQMQSFLSIMNRTVYVNLPATGLTLPFAVRNQTWLNHIRHVQ